jgi:hypothetical protein
MLIADKMDECMSGVFRWEMFSTEHKVELSSHAVVAQGRLFCFDPIPLADDAFDELSRHGPAAIVLSNENHERVAALWRERWQVPVWGAPEASLLLHDVKRFLPGQTQWEGWWLHWVQGGAGGELAFRFAGLSLVVFGDAIVNLPKRGLELLPEKYCHDQGKLRQNLRNLLKEPFERALMAHGQPILESASTKIADLL